MNPAAVAVLPERMAQKLTLSPSQCWTWTGSRHHSEGYGRVYVEWRNGRRITGQAHRVIYEILVGPVPDGLVLDHLCRNRACCNPSHLEPVTDRVNLLRGESFSAVNARKTHCVNGHLFDAANTYIDPKRGGRSCRACNRAAAAQYQARKAAKR